MGQDICSRKDEKPLGYDWECGHEELYVRVNMYYNGSLYVGLWQKQKECEKKLELFGDLTIGVMGFLRPGQAIIQKVRKDICSKMVLIKKNLKQIRVKRYI